MKTFKIQYMNWKGKVVNTYLYANNREEAVQAAKVLQGLSILIKIEEATDAQFEQLREELSSGSTEEI